MSFFGNSDESFENIMQNFFGNSSGVSRRGGSLNRNASVNHVIFKNKIYFIFDFSSEAKINVEVKDQVVLNDYRERVATGEKVLEIKNGAKKIGEFVLPKKIKIKTMESTFNNGILEVSFRK
jgi:HSP20 family molecular chaperone IbpA